MSVNIKHSNHVIHHTIHLTNNKTNKIIITNSRLSSHNFIVIIYGYIHLHIGLRKL